MAGRYLLLAPKAVTMQSSYAPASLRRSSRVPVNVPILVTSLEPGARFSEVCETLVVNAHGCSMRSPVKLDAGVVVHFHSKEGRETTAKVVYCQPLDSDRQAWRLGATACSGGADRRDAACEVDGEGRPANQSGDGENSGFTEDDAREPSEAGG